MDITESEIVLSGLGAARPNSFTKAAKMEIGANRYRKQVLDRLSKFPKNIQRALKDNKAQISDAWFYATAQISGTRAEVIKSQQNKEVGITNIDNAKLSKDRYFVLSAIMLGYDTSSQTGSFSSTWNSALLNAEWELELDGRKNFENMPVRSFYNGISGYNTDKPFGLYELTNPKIIKPQTDIEFNVNFQSSATGYLKAMLIGTVVYAY